ncbi:MAG: hypothetical protein ACOYN8_12305 [Pseudanabaena sp.]
MSANLLTVFFSYSHKDEELRDELAIHLKMMERQGLIADHLFMPRWICNAAIKLRSRGDKLSVHEIGDCAVMNHR